MIPRTMAASSGTDFRLVTNDRSAFEDTPVNQVVATRMLEKCGFQTRVVENGREALEAISEHSYAAVLMDCQRCKASGSVA